MPETFRQMRCLSSALMLALTGATLGACSGGDFGRTRADMRSDDMHRWLGAEVTSSVGARASQFQLTDEERQLRDLAYPLIEPPRSRPAWKSVFGDYKAMPSPWRQNVVFDRTTYGRTLIDEPHRSHSSRYAQLMEDVRDDITRFEPFFASAIRVIDLDRKRNASMRQVSELSPGEGGRGRAHAGELADRPVGAAMPGAACLLLSLGAGEAGDPGAGQHGRGRRPPDRRVGRADRQSAGRGAAALRTPGQRARVAANTIRLVL
jgi:hypothetical protein